MATPRSRGPFRAAAGAAIAALVAAGLQASGDVPRPAGQAASADALAAGRSPRMRVHFAQVMEVHEAVIRGDLAAVKKPADELAGLYRGTTPRTTVDTSAELAALQRAAGDAATAATLFQAAMASARMLKACGDCHRTAGVEPAAPLAAAPAIGGVVGHMLAHQDALDQMLQGLVVPSDALWRSGTGGLAVAPLRAGALPHDARLTERVAASEARIHQLAAQAGAAEDAGARAVFYGHVIVRCADCHAAHPEVWGPARR